MSIRTADLDPACPGRRPTPFLSLSTRCRGFGGGLFVSRREVASFLAPVIRCPVQGQMQTLGRSGRDGFGVWERRLGDQSTQHDSEGGGLLCR